MEKVNVFTDMPEHGTVVATGSPEEIERLLDITEELTSYKLAPRTEGYMKDYKGLLRIYREHWNAICLAHNIPTVWPLSYDEVTGQIYINSK